MAKTVVGTFDSVIDAEMAADALTSSGLDRRAMAVIDNKAGRHYEGEWMGRPAGFWSWFFGDVGDEDGGDFPAEDGAHYTEQLGRGAVFLVVTVADGQAVRVQDLMQRGGAHDVRARTRSTDAEGGSPVRVYTHTMERPVEEHIRLREERFRGQPSISAFESIEPDFQQHFARTFRQSGIAYGECAAAYRYGYELARRERDSGDWETIESEARQEWEQRNPGSWDRFKRAIRYAWDRARSATRAA